jgi:isopentenyldiphosphate isomerase
MTLPPAPSGDEWLDLVDEDDQVVEQMLRSEVYAKSLRNFRAVNLFVRNARGELWTPRRAANKRRWPNAMDISMGEHVQAGETYREALLRGALEELGLDASAAKFLGHCSPQKDGVFDFMEVYEMLANEVPNYNREDFSGFEWLAPAEIMRRIGAGEPTKEDLPILIRTFYPAT